MERNAAETWGAAAAPSPTERSGKVTSGWACGLEGKEGSWGKSERGSQEEKGCGREEEEEENVGVYPTTPGWGTRERSRPFWRYWRIPDYGT